ncbi:HXXEE domain-containing protein [Streptomyces thinghirensis]|nr:HXXEE domain-containing protein [Streptomyces thinghirensis]
MPEAGGAGPGRSTGGSSRWRSGRWRGRGRRVLAAGRLTGGRSAAYQTALNAFGLHGLVHLAQAALVRGYTPGAATSPLVVVRSRSGPATGCAAPVSCAPRARVTSPWDSASRARRRSGRTRWRGG